MDTGSATPARRRDAAATRRSLLAAARTLVAQHGVEGTSTRDVAAVAGVNQGLVYRYFGSKEKLFAEAVGVDDTTTDDLMAATPLDDLPRAVLNRVLDLVDAGDVHSLATLVTAANDDTVRTLIRERVEAGFSTQLAARLDGPDATVRAELLAALLIGIGFLRGKISTRAISSADRETLSAYVDLMAEPLLTSTQETDL